MVKSKNWESKLESYAHIFFQHQEKIRFDISVHSSISIQQANQTITGVDAKINVLLLFASLHSPRERELIKFVEGKGGSEKFLKDENLMKELFALSEGGRETELGKTPSVTAQAKELVEINEQAKQDIGKLIQENRDVFERKFDAQRTLIFEELYLAVRREGDRVIGVIVAGPHDRIMDPVSSKIVSSSLPREGLSFRLGRSRGLERYGTRHLSVVTCHFYPSLVSRRVGRPASRPVIS